ncbi:MAG: hypothetical protein A3K19_28255 [Lentisphaerae bacterium RIFOXYB12_FULL_65_16]|nr:MAG: hypothetical protein A3K18_19505 [Lentisphaerae bacterium RIFOXYA12_64_32]OGV85483.1 MAG: hypothetical protein A3K19_28255 [Lentisphaerae bacterium RIFOXYB12_FULL_65_16]
MVRDDYPRVLFLTPCAFNRVTGGGVLFSNLFRGWPLDSLATVTNDSVPVESDVCRRVYVLSSQELGWMRPFSGLRRWVQASAGGGAPGRAGPLAPGRPPPLWFRIVQRAVGDAGIPDRGRLSPQLARWIEDFQPEVLYTILGSPGIIGLADAIRRRFDLPVAVHLMDEGVTDPKRTGLFGPYLRRLYRRTLTALLASSATRLAICDAMAAEYQERYGGAFQAVPNLVDCDEWTPHLRTDLRPASPARVVYAGSILAFAQEQSLLDTADAVRDLAAAGQEIVLDVYTASARLRPDTARRLSSAPVRLHEAPESDNEFRRLLCSADVLLLPVNFDAGSIHFIRLSLPAKVPPYLASGVPILVYGPAGIAQVEYARQAGWGLVVDQHSPAALAAGLRRVLSDLPLRDALSRAARQTARQHHAADTVRCRFRRALAAAASQRGSPPDVDAC